MGDDVRNVGWLAVVVVIEIPRDEGKDRGRLDRVGFRRRVTDSHLCRGFGCAGLPAFGLGLERFEGGLALLLCALAGVLQLGIPGVERLQFALGLPACIALRLECLFALVTERVGIGIVLLLLIGVLIVGDGLVARGVLINVGGVRHRVVTPGVRPVSHRTNKKAAPDLVWRSGPLWVATHGPLRAARYSLVLRIV